MAIRRYLAMTAAEIRENSENNANLAWMACHFSPYGQGLSNLPRTLPEGALLIVDDMTPIHGHDFAYISQQLTDCIEQLGCYGVLLDFQREGYEKSLELARYLAQALACPVGISSCYAEVENAAVFLPPVPCHIPLRNYLEPWKDQKIWLDLTFQGEILTVTDHGTHITPLPFPDLEETGFPEATLHCHYKSELREDAAIFTLWRTQENLQNLLEEAEDLGVTTAVGLYQELFAKIPPR